MEKCMFLISLKLSYFLSSQNVFIHKYINDLKVLFIISFLKIPWNLLIGKSKATHLEKKWKPLNKIDKIIKSFLGVRNNLKIMATRSKG